MFASRDREAAKLCFEQAIREDPSDSYSHHQLGLLLLEEFNDADAALECYRRAVQVNPQNFAAWASIGNILANKNQSATALQMYDKALEVEPTYARALKNKGLVLEKLKRYSEARDCYKLALEADPNNASIYVVLGLLLQIHFKRAAEAADCFEAAVSVDQYSSAGHIRLAVLCDSNKNYAQAKDHYERAIRIDGGGADTKTLLKYAAVQEQLQDMDGALYTLCVAASKAEEFLKSKTYFHLKKLVREHFPEILLEGGALPTPEEILNAHEFMGSSLLTPSSTSESFTVTPNCRSSVQCPRGHYLFHIKKRPQVYGSKHTWACEECKKSIGGPEFKMNGVYFCDVCKYDLCHQCSRKERVAHFIPRPPQLLGSGGFGTVFKEFVREYGMYCAVKHVPIAMAASVRREVALMQLFPAHTNIVQVLRFDCTNSEAKIIMELMDGCVAGRMKSAGGFLREPEARAVMIGALKGLSVLHRAKPKPVVHRDIKPANLLINFDGSVVKIADFGISKQQAMMTAMQTATAGIKGTPQFLAPECIDLKPKWTPAADVWALGCTWSCMTSGLLPFEGVVRGNDPSFALFSKLFQLFQSNPDAAPLVPQHLSPEAQILMRKCFVRHPAERVSAERLLLDPYFSDEAFFASLKLESQDEYASRVAAARAQRQEVLSAGVAVEDNCGMVLENSEDFYGDTATLMFDCQRDGLGSLQVELPRQFDSIPSAAGDNMPGVLKKEFDRERTDSVADSLAGESDATSSPPVTLHRERGDGTDIASPPMSLHRVLDEEPLRRRGGTTSTVVIDPSGRDTKPWVGLSRRAGKSLLCVALLVSITLLALLFRR